MVWDGLPAHRARLVSEFIRTQQARPAIEWLPGYAPELNPVEYIWGYRKHHELPNLCPRVSPSSVSHQARRALRCMRRRHPRLVRSFWQQARLSLCYSGLNKFARIPHRPVCAGSYAPSARVHLPRFQTPPGSLLDAATVDSSAAFVRLTKWFCREY